MYQLYRCIHCLSEVSGNGKCSICGKTAAEEYHRPMDALPQGYILHEQYYLGKVLGSGGYGITYFAWDMRENRRVAVKEFYPRHMARRKNSVQVFTEDVQEFSHIKQRFCEEAQILCSIRDTKEVLQVYHFFEENSTAYYAMEYLDGMDLQKYLIINGKMCWEELSEAMIMVFRALYVLHKKGVIHRDISPDNIFIRSDRQVRLIDFGSARNYTNANHLTAALKHSFAPLEQYSETSEQGPYTDIYALSVTMYYTLTGKLPPKATSRNYSKKLGKGGFFGVLPLEELCPSIPKYVCKSIYKGMEVNANDRWRSIEEFARSLYPNRNVLGVLNERSKIYNTNTYTQKDLEHKGKINCKNQLRCVRGLKNGFVMNLYARSQVTIGRYPTCTIVYPSNAPGISRHHCTIQVTNANVVYIRDEKSKCGVLVNRSRLTPLQWYLLKPQDTVEIGKDTFVIL